MESIDAAMQLSKIFGLPESEAGILVVEFIFSIVWQLLDASLDDEGLLELTPEANSRWGIKSQEMDIDSYGSFDEKSTESHGILQNANTTMAIEIIGQFLQNKVTSRILYLARQNLYVLLLATLISIICMIFCIGSPMNFTLSIYILEAFNPIFLGHLLGGGLDAAIWFNSYCSFGNRCLC